MFDERLVSRFDLLGESSPPELVTPPIFMAFDCLYRDGRDLRPLPLGERRLLLERVVAGDLVLPVRRLPAQGAEAWAEVQRRGYEGMVAKDEGATYRGGSRLPEPRLPVTPLVLRRLRAAMSYFADTVHATCRWHAQCSWPHLKGARHVAVAFRMGLAAAQGAFGPLPRVFRRAAAGAGVLHPVPRTAFHRARRYGTP